MILTDNETKIDLLNNEAIATTIIELLRDRPEQPVTVGVHGDWGAGKSSVLEMIEAGFEKQTASNLMAGASKVLKTLRLLLLKALSQDSLKNNQHSQKWAKQLKVFFDELIG